MNSFTTRSDTYHSCASQCTKQDRDGGNPRIIQIRVLCYSSVQSLVELSFKLLFLELLLNLLNTRQPRQRNLELAPLDELSSYLIFYELM